MVSDLRFPPSLGAWLLKGQPLHGRQNNTLLQSDNTLGNSIPRAGAFTDSLNQTSTIPSKPGPNGHLRMVKIQVGMVLRKFF
ncbi:hypothetical protein FKM82_022398 [Ascaphus truei]